MEIDPPHESDGSTSRSKENEIYLVSDCHSGFGLPYAPEDFPKPGDKWRWKVGKRLSLSGHYRDRYLFLPDRLHKEYKSRGVNSVASSRGFDSKSSVQRFLMEAFPGMDMKAFFASFTWRIPSDKIKGNTDTVSDCTPKFDPAGCKAGNINCSSLLDLNDSNMIMACDICCIEPLFCHDCCCILCSKTVNSVNGDQTYIRCEAIVNQGLICGHICHIECALRSYLAGTVGGIIGLDAEYYCRRCDAKTDLIPHVKNLIRSCESVCYGDKLQKILNLCVIILRGSTKTSARSLLHHVQAALAKLKEGCSHEDIWKLEDTSAVTTEIAESSSKANQLQVGYKNNVLAHLDSTTKNAADLDKKKRKFKMLSQAKAAAAASAAPATQETPPTPTPSTQATPPPTVFTMATETLPATTQHTTTGVADPQMKEALAALSLMAVKLSNSIDELTKHVQQLIEDNKQMKELNKQMKELIVSQASKIEELEKKREQDEARMAAMQAELVQYRLMMVSSSAKHDQLDERVKTIEDTLRDGVEDCGGSTCSGS